jgi:hypothetical protein
MLESKLVYVVLLFSLAALLFSAQGLKRLTKVDTLFFHLAIRGHTQSTTKRAVQH